MATVKGKEEHETLKQTALDYKVIILYFCLKILIHMVR